MMVNPVGPEDAPLLIIGDEPDFEELRANMPFAGKRGDVLKAELSRAGINLKSCRVTYVNRHGMPKKKEDTPCHGHISDAIREMKNRPFVLLMGAHTTTAFGIIGADAHVGLQVHSFLIPESCGFAMAVTNPPQNSGVGEFRLALSKLKKKMDLTLQSS
jgi:uracil-DNA glycosylase family 4